MNKTKKLSILLLFLTIGFYTGCSKSDDNSDQPEISIVGKWKLTKYEIYTNTTLVETENYVEDNNSCPDLTEFKNDATYSEVEKDANCSITFSETGTYSYNSTTKILTTNSGSINVLTLTNQNLTTETDYFENGFAQKLRTTYVKIN